MWIVEICMNIKNGLIACISDIDDKKLQLQWSLCKITKDICIECCHDKCNKVFNVICGLFSGQYMAIKEIEHA